MGKIRIIAGELRGRRLEVPAGPGVRPTSEKVREALFDILGPAIEDASVLDLFAGSGALGIEAISRGARAATLVERGRDALRALRANVERLGLGERSRILPVDAFRALDSPGPFAPFDVVFLDPPYDSDAVPVLAAVLASHLLQPEALLILERRANAERPEAVPGLSNYRVARYGDSALHFYRCGPRESTRGPAG